MARVKRAVNAHKKRRVVLERASGYRGQRSRLYRKAKEQVLHSMTYAYRDRKDRKGNFRRLNARRPWICGCRRPSPATSARANRTSTCFWRRCCARASGFIVHMSPAIR